MSGIINSAGSKSGVIGYIGPQHRLVGIMHGEAWNIDTNYCTVENNKTYDVILHGHSKAEFTYYMVGIDRWAVTVNNSGTASQLGGKFTNHLGYALDYGTTNAIRVSALNTTNRQGVCYVFERGSLNMDTT